MQTNEKTGIHTEGHIKIWDPETKEVFINKRNAIHYEHFSIALANSIANKNQQFIYQMAFGNGGTSVDPTGIITYLTPNTSGTNTNLYNQTYVKIVDDTSTNNVDPGRNNIQVLHTTGNNYSDVIVTCLLDYGEPSNQSAFDSANSSTDFVFDELGLQSFDANGENLLLTHVLFHPVQKSLNRLIEIIYTIRILTLTGA